MNNHGLKIAAGIAFALYATLASALPPPADVGFDQHIGDVLPLAAQFTDERGTSGPLSRFLGSRPAILILGYYACVNLCSVVRTSLVHSLQAVDLEAGSKYEVIAISIAPEETPYLARDAAAALYGTGKPIRGWHFLTGGADAIAEIARSVGFRYAYDPEEHQYAHPAGLVIVTARGTIARYFFGIDYPPADLRKGLLDAGDNRIASPIRTLLLRCLHYDPKTGKYSTTVEIVARLVGLITFIALAGLAVVSQRRARRSDAL